MRSPPCSCARAAERSAEAKSAGASSPSSGNTAIPTLAREARGPLAQRERLAERAQHLLADARRVLGVVQARQHEREGILLHARRGVALAHAVQQPSRDRAQQAVGDRAAEPRVELAEVVEVDVHQTDARAVAVGLRDRHRQPVRGDERARQAGERIAVDVALRRRPLVLHLAQQELHRGPAAVGHDAGGAFHLGGRAVGAPEPRDEPHARGSGRVGASGGARDLGALVGMHEIAERAARDRGRGRQPQQPAQRRVGEHHAARGLDHDRVGRRGREPLVAVLALAQRLGRAPPLGDVAQRQAAAARRRAGAR